MMNDEILRVLVMGFGVLIGVLSAWGVIRPVRLGETVVRWWSWPWSLSLAMAVRLTLGLVMLLVAEKTRFPAAFTVIGWIAVLAAIVLPVIGKERLGDLMVWGLNRPHLQLRLWCLFGVVFGIFLLYAVA